MALIIGINAYHGDSSACILRDGKLLAAAEEERFRRIKHWAGFPSEAMRYCLREAGARLADVAVIAINSEPKANLLRKVGFAIVQRPDFSFVMERLKNAHERAGLEDEIAAAFSDDTFNGEIVRVEHHLTHLASAFMVSPFKQASVVSVDGFGDFASAAWGSAEGNRINVEGKIYFPHSLGIFYMAMTQHLGFPNWGDEYKIMGLAPYGKPNYLDKMRQIVKLKDDGGFELDMSFFRHHQEKLQEWPGAQPHVNTLYTDALNSLLGRPRQASEELTQAHKDIAASVQAMYEEAFFNLLNSLHRRHGHDAIAIAGGCGMNSVANGKVYRRSPYTRVYVQAAAGDAGGAIGAAYVAHSQRSSAPQERFEMTHAYWGPGYDEPYIAQVLENNRAALDSAGCSVTRVDDEAVLCQRTAQAIAAGKVIGWFQGRMEWGPRALGNRSILGDPRRADMKDILNIKIKRRESFRPFAPSVLREAVPSWFETDDDVPFMMQVFQIRESKRAQIPAVTHVDGSGRLQTVTRESNPRYYRLIQQFALLTDVPMVLNTSFNENEPIVCKPEEALDCFLRTKMDVLVLGDYYVERVG